ncbi:MAG: molecular chaperone HtpG, partial [Cyclobacteriaceae bacterium]
KTGGGGSPFMMGDMPEMLTVTVNANHKMVQSIINAEGEEEKKRLANQAYDLALLAQNMLKGASLTNFIKRSVELNS